MTVRILVILVWLCVFASFSFSQQATTERNKLSLAPASPEASLLFKFTDIPVSKFTGVPGISIPIRKIGTKGINLDLSLQYHASGIRPADVASYVGLGWMLNAGGMISRKVRGLPDDEGPHAFLTIRQLYSFNELNEPKENYFQELGRGCIDAEPDEFYFNVNGYSGKFAFDWSVSNNIIVSCEQPVKVLLFQETPNSSVITKWQLQTPDGYLYTFSAWETTYTEDYQTALGSCKISQPFISSWYVTKIENVNSPSEYAEFSYDLYGFTDNWIVIESKDFGITISPCSGVPLDGAVTKGVSIQAKSSSARPKQIIFHPGNIRVDFIANTIRNDVPQSSVQEFKNKALDNIRIYFDDQLVEEYGFQYDNGTRLMLKRVQKISNGSPEPPYELSYYPGDLGLRNSKRIDAWGYYNGASNASLLPDFTYQTELGVYFFKGANREANAQAGMYQTLQKITYPTGGYSEFKYEGHDYSYVNAQSVASLQKYIPVPKSKTTQLSGDGLIPYTFKSDTGFVQINTIGQALITYSSVTYSCSESNGAVFCFGGRYLPTARIDKIEPGIIKPISSYIHPSSAWSGGNLKSENIYLFPGLYRIIVNVSMTSNNTEGLYDNIAAIISYNENGELIRSMGAGGVRIKEITHFDKVANQAKTILYEYKQQETGISSGVLNGLPVYQDETIMLTTCSDGSLDIYSFYTLTGSNKIAYGESSGSHIGYKEVTTKETGNGRIVSTFWASDEWPDIVNTQKPFGSPTSNAHKRGLPKAESIFDESGNLVKRNSFEYEYSNTDVNSLKVSKKLFCNSTFNNAPITECNTSLPILDRYAIWNNPLRMGFSRIKKQISWERGFETVKEYTYDTRLQLLKQEVFYNTAMPEDKSYVIYRHLIDVPQLSGLTSNQLIAINQLVQQKRMSVVLEMVNKKNNSTLNQTRYNYKVWTNAQVALEEVQESFNTAPLEQKLKIEQYDTNGDIVQQKKANDHAYAYLRDYNSLHIIAEAVNAESKDIAYTSFEANGSGNWVIGGINRVDGNAMTGNKYYELANGQISKTELTPGKTYVLSYWSKAGAYTISGASGSLKQGRTVQSWTYYEHLITPFTTSIILSGVGGVDELKLFPSGALMSTFTYKPMIGISSQCSPLNVIVYYEYDDLNRLSLIRDIDRNVLKKFEYKYQVTGHSVPTWQFTGQTRCKPCPQNPSYILNILQRERKDINPFSSSYNQLEWTDDGVSSSCIISPDFQAISGTYCEQKAGRNTGSVVQLEKDLNPCSPSFEQTREVFKETNLTYCPLSKLYARLRKVNTNGQLTDFAVDMFLDPQATIPFSINPSRSIVIQKQSYNPIRLTESINYFNKSFSGSSQIVLTNAWLQEPGSQGATLINTYTLMPEPWFEVIN